MNGNDALAARRELLSRKLSAIGRLSHHLQFSLGRLPFPIASVDALDDVSLESVSALIERFAKLQDMLGGVFREILVLSGEDATDMNDVLSRVEKLDILPSGDDWRELRLLRNVGAHDYDADDAAKTAFVNELAAQSPGLIHTAKRTAAYCTERLGIVP